MNNLVFGDYCHPINVGERNRLLLSLKEAGIQLCSITSADMNDDDDYDDYPNILYTKDGVQNIITSTASGHHHMGNRLSVEVENTTWRERNDADAFIEFPYIIWLGSLDVVIGTDYTLISITDNQLSVSEFLRKSGCLDTFYHGRKFKHHIV